MDFRLLEQIIREHSGKVIGGVAGGVIGVFIISLGFWHTLFIVACIAAGCVIGRRLDENKNVVEFVEKLLPPGFRR